MRRILLLALILCGPVLYGAARTHHVTLGKALPVKLFVGPDAGKTIDIKVRPLLVDGDTRHFTTGEPHELTDHSFVIRRAFRMNDRLPEEPRQPPKWRWQRGGWLLVDRVSGRITELRLPDFDPYYSAAVWYRDYAAYCGLSGDGEKLFAVVAQVGQRKALLHRQLGMAKQQEQPESECEPPKWHRDPPRVTFQAAGGQPLTFDVHGRAADPDPPEAAE